MEDKLLLFCLDMGNEKSKAAEMALWKDSEWNELIRQSARHGISAYLYHRLKAIEPAVIIPLRIDLRLREITLRNASQNMRLYHGLAATLKPLKDEGIPVILLKGAHLAGAVYDNIALRSMGDVDIMVHKGDLHKTVMCLVHSGFHLMNEDLTRYIKNTTHTQYHVLSEAKHFFDLVHPDRRIKLDVHVSLTPETSSFDVDTDGVWQRAVKVNADGTDTLALSLVDSILYQCIHASYHHHFTYGLRPLCDITETIRHYRAELNWDELRARAFEWKADKCAWISLSFAKDILGADIPETVLSAMKPVKIDSEMITWAKARIFSNQKEGRTLPDDLVKLWRSKRLLDKAGAVRRAVFPSRQIMAVMYPAPPDSLRIFLYYPVRIKDLLVRWGRTGLSMLFHNKETLKVVETENREVSLRQWLMDGGK